MLTWQAAGGFSIDASVHIAAHDRAGLERLLRYCAHRRWVSRPPFALERIEATSYGATGGARIVYRPPPIPHRAATPLSRSPPSSSSRGSLRSFLRHAFIATAIKGCWLPGYPPKVGPKLRYQVIAVRA